MLCEECLQPFYGDRPPRGYNEYLTGRWTQGSIDELHECFICIRIWRYISDCRLRNASRLYNIVRDFRICESNSGNVSEGIWALYHIRITGEGIPDGSELSFSVKSFNGQSTESCNILNPLMLRQNYELAQKKGAQLRVGLTPKQLWRSQYSG